MTRTPLPELTDADLQPAFRAIEGEVAYVNDLPRRTADEAKDVPGFITLAQTLLAEAAEIWATTGGTEQTDGSVQVEAALHHLRKTAAVLVRAMVVCGVRERGEAFAPSGKQLQIEAIVRNVVAEMLDAHDVGKSAPDGSNLPGSSDTPVDHS